MLNSFADESASFDAMAKQTPYRYSADAKEIIRNVHNFCKPEKEAGLKIFLNQAKERISTMTRVKRILTETRTCIYFLSPYKTKINVKYYRIHKKREKSTLSAFFHVIFT